MRDNRSNMQSHRSSMTRSRSFKRRCDVGSKHDVSACSYGVGRWGPLHRREKILVGRQHMRFDDHRGIASDYPASVGCSDLE